MILPLQKESEFLKLAGFMMYCRARIMGLDIEDDPYPYDLEGSLLGYMDYAAEMKLIIHQERNDIKRIY